MQKANRASCVTRVHHVTPFITPHDRNSLGKFLLFQRTTREVEEELANEPNPARLRFNPSLPLRSIISSFFVVRSNKESLNRHIKLNTSEVFSVYLFFIWEEERKRHLAKQYLKMCQWKMWIIVLHFYYTLRYITANCENRMLVDP